MINIADLAVNFSAQLGGVFEGLDKLTKKLDSLSDSDASISVKLSDNVESSLEAIASGLDFIVQKVEAVEQTFTNVSDSITNAWGEAGTGIAATTDSMAHSMEITTKSTLDTVKATKSFVDTLLDPQIISGILGTSALLVTLAKNGFHLQRSLDDVGNTVGKLFSAFGSLIGLLKTGGKLGFESLGLGKLFALLPDLVTKLFATASGITLILRGVRFLLNRLGKLGGALPLGPFAGMVKLIQTLNQGLFGLQLRAEAAFTKFQLFLSSGILLSTVLTGISSGVLGVFQSLSVLTAGVAVARSLFSTLFTGISRRLFRFQAALGNGTAQTKLLLLSIREIAVVIGEVGSFAPDLVNFLRNLSKVKVGSLITTAVRGAQTMMSVMNEINESLRMMVLLLQKGIPAAAQKAAKSVESVLTPSRKGRSGKPRAPPKDQKKKAEEAVLDKIETKKLSTKASARIEDALKLVSDGALEREASNLGSRFVSFFKATVGAGFVGAIVSNFTAIKSAILGVSDSLGGVIGVLFKEGAGGGGGGGGGGAQAAAQAAGATVGGAFAGALLEAVTVVGLGRVLFTGLRRTVLPVLSQFRTGVSEVLAGGFESLFNKTAKVAKAAARGFQDQAIVATRTIRRATNFLTGNIQSSFLKGSLSFTKGITKTLLGVSLETLFIKGPARRLFASAGKNFARSGLTALVRDIGRVAATSIPALLVAPLKNVKDVAVGVAKLTKAAFSGIGKLLSAPVAEVISKAKKGFVDMGKALRKALTIKGVFRGLTRGVTGVVKLFGRLSGISNVISANRQAAKDGRFETANPLGFAGAASKDAEANRRLQRRLSKRRERLAGQEAQTQKQVAKETISAARKVNEALGAMAEAALTSGELGRLRDAINQLADSSDIDPMAFEALESALIKAEQNARGLDNLTETQMDLASESQRVTNELADYRKALAMVQKALAATDNATTGIVAGAGVDKAMGKLKRAIDSTLDVFAELQSPDILKSDDIDGVIKAGTELLKKQFRSVGRSAKSVDEAMGKAARFAQASSDAEDLPSQVVDSLRNYAEAIEKARRVAGNTSTKLQEVLKDFDFGSTKTPVGALRKFGTLRKQFTQALKTQLRAVSSFPALVSEDKLDSAIDIAAVTAQLNKVAETIESDIADLTEFRETIESTRGEFAGTSMEEMNRILDERRDVAIDELDSSERALKRTMEFERTLKSLVSEFSNVAGIENLASTLTSAALHSKGVSGVLESLESTIEVSDKQAETLKSSFAELVANADVLAEVMERPPNVSEKLFDAMSDVQKFEMNMAHLAGLEPEELKETVDSLVKVAHDRVRFARAVLKEEQENATRLNKAIDEQLEATRRSAESTLTSTGLEAAEATNKESVDRILGDFLGDTAKATAAISGVAESADKQIVATGEYVEALKTAAMALKTGKAGKVFAGLLQLGSAFTPLAASNSAGKKNPGELNPAFTQLLAKGKGSLASLGTNVRKGPVFELSKVIEEAVENGVSGVGLMERAFESIATSEAPAQLLDQLAGMGRALEEVLGNSALSKEFSAMFTKDLGEASVVGADFVALLVQLSKAATKLKGTGQNSLIERFVQPNKELQDSLGKLTKGVTSASVASELRDVLAKGLLSGAQLGSSAAKVQSSIEEQFETILAAAGSSVTPKALLKNLDALPKALESIKATLSDDATFGLSKENVDGVNRFLGLIFKSLKKAGPTIQGVVMQGRPAVTKAFQSMFSGVEHDIRFRSPPRGYLGDIVRSMSRAGATIGEQVLMGASDLNRAMREFIDQGLAGLPMLITQVMDTGLKSVKTGLDSTFKSFGAAFTGVFSGAGSLVGSVFPLFGVLIKGIGAVTNEVIQLAGTFASLLVGAIQKATFAVGKLAQTLVGVVAESTRRIKELSLEAGRVGDIDVNSFRRVQRTLRRFGVDASETAQTLITIKQAAQDAAEGGVTPMTRALQVMGISIETLKEATPEDIFLSLADGLSTVGKDSIELKTALEAAGAQFTNLRSALTDPEFARVLGQMQQGNLIDKEDIKNAKAFQDINTTLVESFEAFQDGLSVSLLKAFELSGTMGQFSSLTEKAATAGKALGEALVSVTKILIDLFKNANLLQTVKDFSRVVYFRLLLAFDDAFKAFGKVLKRHKPAIIKAVATLIVTGAVAVRPAILIASKVMGKVFGKGLLKSTVAAIFLLVPGALVGALDLITEKLDDLAGTLTGPAKSFVEGLSNGLDSLGAGVVLGAEAASSGVGKIFENIEGAVGNSIDLIVGKAEELDPAALVQEADAAISKLDKSLVPLKEGLSEINAEFAKAGGAIAKAGRGVADMADGSNKARRALDAAQSGLRQVQSRLKDTQSTLKAITSVLSGAAERATQFRQNLSGISSALGFTSTIKRDTQQALNQLTILAEGLTGQITSTVGSIGNAVRLEARKAAEEATAREGGSLAEAQKAGQDAIKNVEMFLASIERTTTKQAKQLSSELSRALLDPSTANFEALNESVTKFKATLSGAATVIRDVSGIDVSGILDFSELFAVPGALKEITSGLQEQLRVIEESAQASDDLFSSFNSGLLDLRKGGAAFDLKLSRLTLQVNEQLSIMRSLQQQISTSGLTPALERDFNLAKTALAGLVKRFGLTRESIDLLLDETKSGTKSALSAFTLFSKEITARAKEMGDAFASVAEKARMLDVLEQVTQATNGATQSIGNLGFQFLALEDSAKLSSARIESSIASLKALEAQGVNVQESLSGIFNVGTGDAFFADLTAKLERLSTLGRDVAKAEQTNTIFTSVSDVFTRSLDSVEAVFPALVSGFERGQRAAHAFGREMDATLLRANALVATLAEVDEAGLRDLAASLQGSGLLAGFDLDSIPTAELATRISDALAEAVKRGKLAESLREVAEVFRVNVAEPITSAFTSTLRGIADASIFEAARTAATAAAEAGQKFSTALFVVSKFGEELFANSLNALFSNLQENLTDLLTNALTDVFASQAVKDGIAQLGPAFEKAVKFGVTGLLAVVGLVLSRLQSSATVTQNAIESAVTASEQVRGVISGDSTVAIKEIDESLREALVGVENRLDVIISLMRQPAAGQLSIQPLASPLSQTLANRI